MAPPGPPQKSIFFLHFFENMAKTSWKWPPWPTKKYFFDFLKSATFWPFFFNLKTQNDPKNDHADSKKKLKTFLFFCGFNLKR